MKDELRRHVETHESSVRPPSEDVEKDQEVEKSLRRPYLESPARYSLPDSRDKTVASRRVVSGGVNRVGDGLSESGTVGTICQRITLVAWRLRTELNTYIHTYVHILFQQSRANIK